MQGCKQLSKSGGFGTLAPLVKSGNECRTLVQKSEGQGYQCCTFAVIACVWCLCEVKVAVETCNHDKISLL